MSAIELLLGNEDSHGPIETIAIGGLVQGTGGYVLETDMQQYARSGNSPVAEEATGKQIKAGIKCNDGERADHDYSTFPVANFRRKSSTVSPQ